MTAPSSTVQILTTYFIIWALSVFIKSNLKCKPISLQNHLKTKLLLYELQLDDETIKVMQRFYILQIDEKFIQELLNLFMIFKTIEMIQMFQTEEKLLSGFTWGFHHFDVSDVISMYDL